VGYIHFITVRGGVIMASNLWCYQLLLAALMLVCLLIHGCWPDPLRARLPRSPKADQPRRRWSKEGAGRWLSSWGGGVLRYRPRGVSEGWKASLESSWPA